MSYKGILSVLKKLHTAEPNINFGRHISTAVSQGNLFSFSDDVILEKLEDYLIQCDLKKPESEKDLEKILKDGLNLHQVLEEDSDDY